MSTQWRGAGLSHVGLVRRSNQDALALRDHLGLWVIADGMGGHPGGDVASRIAVETITAHVEALARSPAHRTPDPSDMLRQAVIQAQEAIGTEAATHADLAEMGTTVVVAHIPVDSRSPGIIAHVGDSRAYLCRDGALIQLTRDHSWLEDQLRMELLSPQEAANHPLRHRLSRALRAEQREEPDLLVQDLETGDRILLCTDGLTKMLSDGEILDTLLRHDGRTEATCAALIRLANERGGHDNVTVALIAQASASGA